MALSSTFNSTLVMLMAMSMRAAIMGAKFALAIFIAHYLDLSSLGLYGLATGAIAIVPVMVNMGMNHLLMRMAVNVGLDELFDSLRQYWTFISVIYVLIFIAAIGVTVTFDSPSIWILLVAVIYLEHIGNDAFYLLSNLQRHLAANVIAFVRGAAWVAIYMPLAIVFPDLRNLSCLFGAWMACGLASIVLFAILSRSWPWKKGWRCRFRVSFVINTIRESYLLYVSDLSFIAGQYIDRYLVTLFLGIKAAGVYFLFWTVANATTTFLALVLQQKQRPLMIRAYAEGGDTAHRNLTRRFMRVSFIAAFALSAMIAAAFQVSLFWLRQPDLTAHISALWLIVIGMAVRYMADFSAMALFSSHQDRAMTITHVSSALLLIAAQLVLLPLAGLYGAGAAILLTSVGILVWRYRLLFASSTPWRSEANPGSGAPLIIS